jgi:molybdopterin synthase sulfur carrier subunit
MKIFIPTPLQSYTHTQSQVVASGATLAEALDHLDRQFPGIRFRIINEQDQVREHIKIFVNEDLTKQLTASVGTNDTIHIICALSGG